MECIKNKSGSIDNLKGLETTKGKIKQGQLSCTQSDFFKTKRYSSNTKKQTQNLKQNEVTNMFQTKQNLRKGL